MGQRCEGASPKPLGIALPDGPRAGFLRSAGPWENNMIDDTQVLDSVSEEQAYQLSEAAIRLDLARQNRDGDPTALIDALNQNVEVWLKLRTIVMREDCSLPESTCVNLVKLSQFVVNKTFGAGDGLTEAALDALISINLQISEGLLEGRAN